MATIELCLVVKIDAERDGKTDYSSMILLWLQMTVGNFFFYSWKFSLSFTTAFLSLAFFLNMLDKDQINYVVVGLTLILWLFLMFPFMEYARIKMTNALLSILSNQNADEVINNLSDGVVILNEATNEVLFTNREATEILESLKVATSNTPLMRAQSTLATIVS